MSTDTKSSSFRISGATGDWDVVVELDEIRGLSAFFTIEEHVEFTTPPEAWW